MDFLEGFLMGPRWSDTEYETRHHIGFYLLIGLITALGFAYCLVYPALAARWLWPWPILLLLTTAMMIWTPFLCRDYYRRNWLVRWLILLALAAKTILILLLVMTVALPLIQFDLPTLGDQLMRETNDSIARMTDRFANFSNAFAMILGIVAGGLAVLLRLTAVAAAAIALPGLALAIFRLLQRGVDWLVSRQMKPGDPDTD